MDPVFLISVINKNQKLKNFCITGPHKDQMLATLPVTESVLFSEVKTALIILFLLPLFSDKN
jgi:hypothetical protein